MKTKTITPTQYAEMRGWHFSYVQRQCRDNRPDILTKVLKIQSFGRFYLLTVPAYLSKKSFKKNKTNTQ